MTGIRVKKSMQGWRGKKQLIRWARGTNNLRARFSHAGTTTKMKCGEKKRKITMLIFSRGQHTGTEGGKKTFTTHPMGKSVEVENSGKTPKTQGDAAREKRQGSHGGKGGAHSHSVTCGKAAEY